MTMCISRFVPITLVLLSQLALSWSSTAVGEDRDRHSQTIQPFLAKHCLSCHGSNRQEADVRLDDLEPTFDRIVEASLWAEVRDRLNGGTMPPETEPRPDPDELAVVSDWIAEGLRASREQTSGRLVLRRLNRVEYTNTIRDLLGVRFEATSAFPEDPPAHGFDNIGSALQVSPILIEKYLDAARSIVDQAVATGPKPGQYLWHMEVETSHPDYDLPGRKTAGESEVWTKDPYLDRHRYLIKGSGVGVEGEFLIQKATRDEGAAGFRWFKIPESGLYTIRVRAAAVVPTREQVLASTQKILLANLARGDWQSKSAAEQTRLRQQWLREEWPEIAEHFSTDAMYDYGFPRMKVTTDEGVIIDEVSVEASLNDPHVYEFTFEFEASGQGNDGVNITNNYQVPRVLENHWFQGDPEFARPELWIDWVEFEGVTIDDWPPKSHDRLLLSGQSFATEEDRARAVIERFLPLAFRRPSFGEEIEPLVQLFLAVRPSKLSFAEAIKIPIQAALCSPHFLYLVEPGDEDLGPRPLDDYELASRLSYFLWSSMPDAELFALAEGGQLSNPKVLQEQVDRLLADPRSQAFVENFVGQWLQLREVGANPPVANLHPRYDDHLAESMVGEGEAFFAEVLFNDLDVSSFLRSEFVVINERLARFYGIANVHGDQFRKVALAPRSRRGGLVTQAGVLTLTSNGTRTSPVIRGAWILTNLLGDPPPPPPPDAGDLAPQVPGIDKATVRDRLEAHRRIEQCARCHNKIDPIGFALENFDAHGRWRNRYGFGYNGRVGDRDPLVDARAELPGREPFEGVDGLRSFLVEQEDRFLVCLTEKLMTYALGRGLGPGDQAQRDHLVEVLREERTLRRLIQELVTGETFLSR